MVKAPETRAIELRYGVEVDGLELTTLNMRPPLAHDSHGAQRGANGQADMEIRLFANLCGVAPETIERLQMADYMKLQEAYQAFLG